MNTEKLCDALECDTKKAYFELWKRHVRVLQEYVHELTEALREIETVERGEVDQTLPTTLIEQAVFNSPEGMENYNAYRIEYGGHAMECVMEGVIWLPPGVDPQTIERILQGGEPCKNTE